MDERPVNPLSAIIHERYIERPDSINRCSPNRRSAPGHYKLDWHPVAAAVAMMGSLLSQKGHSWGKREKMMYRKAINSVKHPCCPTCGKPMSESAVTHNEAVHKSWFCAEHQNL